MQVNQIGPNKTIITFNTGDAIGFSYKTPVVARIGNDTFRTERSYSVTTSKHCGQLLSHLGGNFVGEKPQSFFDELGERV